MVDPSPTTLLSLLAALTGISGMLLAWKGNRRQERSSFIEDLDKVRKALGEENERLQEQITALKLRLDETEKTIIQLKHEKACTQERVSLEREVFDKKLRQLEEGLDNHAS